ncbi:MAG: glycogen debranching N-terminal domain-containing protein [Dongiaceae bacterium]
MDDKTAASAADADSEAASLFYIPAAASLPERRLRALKHGDTFALFNSYGDILPFPGAPDGLYHRDTRYLSHLELRLNGQRPLLLSSTVNDDNAVLAVDLTNPDFYADGELLLPRDMLHVQRLKFVWQRSCHERIAVRNYDARRQAAILTLRFDGDFADLFEVRGQVRPRRGTAARLRLSDRAAAVRYDGLDGVARFVTVRLTPAPTRLEGATATYELTLAPGQQTKIFVQIECGTGGEPAAEGTGFAACMHAARRALKQSTTRAARIVSSNSQFNQLLSRALSDLYMLVTDTPQGPYPYAGIPWFSTAFGRDGLLTGLFTLWIDPAIAKGVLKYLAATQATATDPDRDAEPGKILHETRGGEMARLREVPFELYYGSVDATPLFIALAGAYVDRTADLETLRSIWPSIEAALAWIDRCGDADGDGFVEYNRHSETGLVNQGWKDSHDSVFHADGRLAPGPIALCEVQAYVYLAKRGAAKMARLLDRPEMALELEHQADLLRQRFEAAFWCEELSTYALALDGEKRPCRVRSSNAGHALFAGIADPERARRLAAGLLDSGFFAGWGIRTVAAEEPRFNPISYHNGSVWPHDNAVIALGFDRYGFKDAALRILTAMFDASNYVDLRRMPELFCGFRRLARTGPTFYPVACAPQAWATAAPFALLQAALGLSLDHRSGEIRFKRPVLPEFLDGLMLRDLRLGDRGTEIEIARHGQDVAINVPRRSDNLRVVVIH